MGTSQKREGQTIKKLFRQPCIPTFYLIIKLFTFRALLLQISVSKGMQETEEDLSVMNRGRRVIAMPKNLKKNPAEKDIGSCN